jgi:hypothetical protein
MHPPSGLARVRLRASGPGLVRVSRPAKATEPPPAFPVRHRKYRPAGCSEQHPPHPAEPGLGRHPVPRFGCGPARRGGPAAPSAERLKCVRGTTGRARETRAGSRVPARADAAVAQGRREPGGVGRRQASGASVRVPWPSRRGALPHRPSRRRAAYARPGLAERTGPPAGSRPGPMRMLGPSQGASLQSPAKGGRGCRGPRTAAVGAVGDGAYGRVWHSAFNRTV